MRLWICKSRRAGISTGVEAEIYWDTTTFPNRNSLIIGNQRGPSENVLDMCRKFWMYTPEQFRPKLPPSFNPKHPPKDRIEFIFEQGVGGSPLSSKMFVASALSLDQYLGHGFHNIHATEVAYYADGRGLFRAIYPTLVKGESSMFFGESTPNGMGGKGRFFYEECIKANESRGRSEGEFGRFRLLFIAWHEMRLSYRSPFRSERQRREFEYNLTSEERDLIKLYNVDLEMLNWRRAMIASPLCYNDSEIFDQEYPSSLATAFLSTGYTVFSRQAIKRLDSRKRPPKWEGDIYWGDSTDANHYQNSYDLVRRPKFLTAGEARAEGFEPHVNEGTYRNFAVFRWPEKDETLVLAADVAEGNPNSRDGDYSTIVVLSAKAFERDEVIARWKGHCDPVHFAHICAALSWGLCRMTGEDNPPKLAVEWNKDGKTTNTTLDKFGLYPVYKYQPPGVTKMPKSKHVGWETNSKTKPIAVGYMRSAVEKDQIDIPDEQIIIEMSAYRASRSTSDEESSYDGEGMHDDLVASLQIAIAVARLGTYVGEKMDSEPLDTYGGDDDDGTTLDPELGWDEETGGDSGFEDEDEDGDFAW